MNDITIANTMVAKHQNPFIANIYKYRYLYLLLLPGLVWVIVFKYAPMYGIIIAFKDYNIFKGINDSPWVGMANFNRFFQDNYFGPLMRNTLLISLYKIMFGFPLPIIIALMLNEVRNVSFKRTVQTIIYFPHFLSWVIVGGLIVTLLSPDGLINGLITMIGGESTTWMARPEYFRTILVLSDIWKESGWGTVIYMAALAGIDPQLYEAAVIDGASRLQRMRHITLPSLMPTIIIMLILRMGSIMDAGFEQVFLLLNPSVMQVGDIIDTFVYRVGLEQQQYSFSTAVGLFKSVINIIFVVGTNYIAKKAGQESLF
ncbi:ABC transporter permease [Mahella australiensis]|uniref:Carbohydrate ABC transporter membrane protein 1, CUT1 family n=1 Tax=Mahella australiensis (strain DSM 15567 / CIP 107919 / 50-1 BON) TaxID=697281 RepID=F3ZYU9_MAHA5|nr:ABC transporter permease subunit [Mahella australiensis]AEE95694.1 carbohydrate ABC transporter membrane protein 1, CUT1 family [Mahella australiensis 50-1 BON]